MSENHNFHVSIESFPGSFAWGYLLLIVVECRLIFCHKSFYQCKSLVDLGLLLDIDYTMKRKRSRVSRQPRVNADTQFHSDFGCLSLVKPFGKQAENENVKDTMVASAGLGTDNKPKKLKLKLKFGGVTHSIHAKSKTETGFSSDSLMTRFSPCSDHGPKPQDDTDGNYACPFDKRRGLGDKLLKPYRTESGFTAENHSRRGKITGESINVNHEQVCKSKRITRRCALSVGISDDHNEDAELHFLKDPGIPGPIKDGKMNDKSISERKKPKRESVDVLVRGKECTLSHNCSVDSFKDVLFLLIDALSTSQMVWFPQYLKV
ncbi:hypothetical protein CR513_47359, partial [Mucuna pruriens]